MGDWKKKGSKPAKRYGGMCACILITFTDLWQQNNVAFSSIDSCCQCVLVYRHKYICCFHCCEQHCFFMRFCVACTCFLFPSYWTDEQRSNGINLCFTVHGSCVNDSYTVTVLIFSLKALSGNYLPRIHTSFISCFNYCNLLNRCGNSIIYFRLCSHTWFNPAYYVFISVEYKKIIN